MLRSNVKIMHTVKQFECDELNPSHLFKQFEHMQGQRYFYINKERDEWIVGLGHEVVIKEHFIDSKSVHEHYCTLLKHTEVIGELPSYVCLFGGFQFDNGVNEDFESFGHSHFIWPTVQFRFTGGRYIVSMTNLSEDEQNEVVRRMKAPIAEGMLSEIVSAKDIEVEAFQSRVKKAVTAMNSGEFEKVVLSRTKEIVLDKTPDNSVFVHHGYSSEEYSYFLLLEEGYDTYISKTPEQLVKATKDELLTNAIAGTMSKEVPNAKDVLLNDKKNNQEHQIVVDSICDDLSQVVNHIKKDNEPSILENAYFYHLYTKISGDVKAGNLLDAATALHPTPALGGYPKRPALDFILRMEGNRGFYGAPMGYIDSEMSGEFIVAIRSCLIRNNKVKLYAGSGVVVDSTPEAETEETSIKFKPMLHLLGVSF